MLKQGQTWYPLSNVREMMEIEENMPPINKYAYRTLRNHKIIIKIVYKIIIMKHLYYSKMAKEMNVSCDFMEHKLNCVLPEQHHGCTPEGMNEIGRTHI